MNILFLRGFNNYHKRSIIKYSALTDYQNNSASFLNYSGINFNPNDGVATELIVGNPDQKENSKILAFDELGTPDYCVCYEIEDDEAVIKSRWFVLESERTRAGQYHLALKRDVIADNKNWIMNSDVFIEKGQIKNENSPFLFNSEGMTYNQIKKKEIPLYDSTGTAWIVGYVAKNYDATAEVTGVINHEDNNDGLLPSETPWGELTEEEMNTGITFGIVDNIDIFGKISGAKGTGFWAGGFRTIYAYMAGRSKLILDEGSISNIDSNYGRYYEAAEQRKNVAGVGLGSYNIDDIPINGYNGVVGAYPNRSNIKAAEVMMGNFIATKINGLSVPNKVISELETNLTDYQYLGESALMRFNNRILRVEEEGGSSSKFYSISITKKSVYTDTTDISTYLASDTRTQLRNNFITTLNDMDNIDWSNYQDKQIKICREIGYYQIKFTKVPATLQVKVTLPKISDRWGCNDQLFDIFCIPYGQIKVFDSVAQESVYTQANAGLAAARAMAKELGSNLYDLQILPYCPIKEIRDAYEYSIKWYERTNNPSARYNILEKPYLKYHGDLIIDDNDPEYQGMYDKITSAETHTVLSYVFWAYQSHGTIDIPVMMTDDNEYQYDTYAGNDILKKKISNETEIIRICSPNYNGVFEFNPAKNNNNITTTLRFIPASPVRREIPNVRFYNVDYTYRPNNPYIHVNPIFKDEDEGGIYGKDFNDARGLICGGDFSLGYIIDAYRNYQIQNANFQNIFDRQIQNLDINNRLAYEQTQFSSTMSALGLGLGGPVMGAQVGSKAGPYGAVAGAVVGGMAGIGAGIAGYNMNMNWLERQQQETRNYMIDMYNYNLGNVKALPYSISRTDCLSENTRLVPFLEIYRCTEQEVINLLNIIKYNGMTVMKIDKPYNYIGSSNYEENYQQSINCHDKACYYIKGRLINNPETDIEDDFHVVDAIYEELNKGIYLEGE